MISNNHKRQLDEIDDEECGVVNHLLDIRGHWDNSNLATEPTGTVEDENEKFRNNTTAHLFHPKFITIFETYCEIYGKIDVSLHLMSICLEHLIGFSCWARESDARAAWIRSSLDDNSDLRPEVRNGLALVYIYCISAAKSRLNSTDMFSILQDSNQGLAIVNKTSLKIYNDPFDYFGFVKACVSGLIDANVIPENERQNQPKKSKRQMENKEELEAFLVLKNGLVALLNSGDNVGARARVQQILSLWQSRVKNLRSHRFGMAVRALNSSSQNHSQFVASQLDLTRSQLPMPRRNVSSLSSSSTSASASASSSLNHGGLEGSIDSSSAGVLCKVPSQGYLGQGQLSSAGALELTTHTHASATASASAMVPAESALKDETQVPQAAHISVAATTREGSVEARHGSHGHRSTKAARTSDHTHLEGKLFSPLQVFRYERVGLQEWLVKDCQIYDFTTFISTVPSPIFLVDHAKLNEVGLGQPLQRLRGQATGFSALQSELHDRAAVVTSWNHQDFPQLRSIVDVWNGEVMEWMTGHSSSRQEATPPRLWVEFANRVACADTATAAPSNSSSSSASSSSGDASFPRHVLVYEVNNQIGLVLRACEALQLTSDCWRLLFANELSSELITSQSFGIFLSGFFPQCRNHLQRSQKTTNQGDGSHSQADHSDWCTIVIMYRPHQVSHPILQPPDKAALGTYQTIGTLADSTSLVLARFAVN